MSSINFDLIDDSAFIESDDDYLIMSNNFNEEYEHDFVQTNKKIEPKGYVCACDANYSDYIDRGYIFDWCGSCFPDEESYWRIFKKVKENIDLLVGADEVDIATIMDNKSGLLEQIGYTLYRFNIKRHFKNSVKEELIANVMHPSRIMKKMEHYDDFETFFDNI